MANFKVRPSSDGVYRSRYPAGDYVNNVIDFSPTSVNDLLMGTNITNPVGNGSAWPMADLVKHSFGWARNSGTGAVSIDGQDRVTSIEGDAVLEKVLFPSDIDGLPRLGTYHIFINNGTAETMFFPVEQSYSQVASRTIEITTSNQNLSVFVRSSDGSAQTMMAVAIVHEDDLVAYQANPLAFNTHWLAYMRDRMQPKVVRPLLPHEVYEEFWSQRTLPEALSYSSVANRVTGLIDEDGSRHATFPLEIQVQLANELGVHVLWWNTPPHANDEWITNAASLIESRLNEGIALVVSLSNETFNQGGPFYHGTEVVRTFFRNKTRLVVTPGDNVVTGVHPFSDGDLLCGLVAPASERSTALEHFSNRIPANDYQGATLTIMQVVNASVGRFELINPTDNQPLITPVGCTSVDFWVSTPEDISPDSTTDHPTQVAQAHGQRSAQIFTIVESEMPGRVIYKMLETQADNPGRTLTLLSSAGGGDDLYVGLGSYFDSASLFEAGDGIPETVAKGLLRIEEFLTNTVEAHIAAGVPGDRMCCYEGGPHWTVHGLLQDSSLWPEAIPVFSALAESSEIVELEEYWWQRIREYGIRFACISSMDFYIFSEFGSWGSKTSIESPDIPRTLAYERWGGRIRGASVADNEFFVNGNSLFTYTGGGDAPASDGTTVGYWLGMFASLMSVQSVGSYGGGYPVAAPHLDDWSDLSSINVAGAYSANTEVFDSEFNGLVNDNVGRFIFMPSNFVGDDMGSSPPYDLPVANFVARAQQLMDGYELAYPGSEKMLFVHGPDAGAFAGIETDDAVWHNYLRAGYTDYEDWFLSAQGAMVAAGYDLRLIPVYPIIYRLIDAAFYFDGVTFADVMGDSAPHGRPTAYFLYALVMFRAIYRRDVDLTNFVYPVGEPVLQVVRDNWAQIVRDVEYWLDRYHLNGWRVY